MKILSLRRQLVIKIAVVLSLCISGSSHAYENFFEPPMSSKEANEQLAKTADILANAPQNLWNKSTLIVLIPTVKIVTVGIGGSFGNGILVTRLDGQLWGNPIFVRLASGRIEVKANSPSLSMLLTFDGPQNLERIIKGGGFNPMLAKVYIYDGQVFNRVSLTGLINIEVNRATNTNFYGQKADIFDIVNGKITTDSKALTMLMEILGQSK